MQQVPSEPASKAQLDERKRFLAMINNEQAIQGMGGAYF
jgi:hypothetical protein